MKACPFCAEDIQDAALVCKHCGRQVTSVAVPPTPGAAQQATDPTLAAVGLTLLSIVAMFVVTPFVVVPGTALWAAWDSEKIGLQRYRSGVSSSPIVLLLMILLLWIAVFPWYVAVRQNIKRGLVPLK